MILRALPSASEFLGALERGLEWLLGAGQPGPALPAVPGRPGEKLIARPRFAARNHLLVEIEYQGIGRLVEPYSLRVPRTGNLLLYVWEVKVTAQSFEPRYRVEL